MKINKTPLVYIIMPCYNSEKYLLEQLMSIYYQNYINWYLIFVNDGSTDSSEKIIRDFISHYNLYDKVKIITKENGGVNSAVQMGLEEVKNLCDSSSLISYCDSDDIWTREKLFVQVSYMVNHPECGLSYHDLAIIDNNSVLIQTSMLKNVYHSDESFLAISTLGTHFYSTEMMFRVEYINEIIPMPTGFGMAQDHRTAIVLSALRVNIQYIDKKLSYYRKSQNSLLRRTEKADLIKRYESYLRYILLIQEKYKEKNFNYEICYFKDKFIKWHNNKYSSIRIYILTFFKYPRNFILGFKAFIYEKMICKIKHTK